MDGFKIAELSARTGFSGPTLRYYEDIGLLEPADRTESGHRVYDTRDEARLRFIARAKRLGLSLDDIGKLVAVWADGECATTRGTLRELLEAKIIEVRHQVEESATFLRQLEAVSDRLSRRTGTEQDGSGCDCAPELPPVPGVHLPDVLAGRSETAAEARSQPENPAHGRRSS